MLSYEEARDRLLSEVPLQPAERVPLAEASGRVLAKAMVARLTQPSFAASAMDGYALRWSDMPGPWTVIGESAAGAAFAGRVAREQAVRILTGAPVPDGADTVMVQEDADRSGDTLRMIGDGPPALGAHIRSAGNDFSAGDTLLPAPARIGPAAIGLAASAGLASLSVRRRPRVALIATGNELVAPGEIPGPAQIVASSGVMLAAMLRHAGAEVRDLGIVSDSRAAIADTIRSAADADMIVTQGGRVGGRS